jgi:hypothetical protein
MAVKMHIYSTATFFFSKFDFPATFFGLLLSLPQLLTSSQTNQKVVANSTSRNFFLGTATFFLYEYFT